MQGDRDEVDDGYLDILIQRIREKTRGRLKIWNSSRFEKGMRK